MLQRYNDGWGSAKALFFCPLMLVLTLVFWPELLDVELHQADFVLPPGVALIAADQSRCLVASIYTQKSLGTPTTFVIPGSYCDGATVTGLTSVLEYCAVHLRSVGTSCSVILAI
jgi:hypothetical protein